MIVVADTSPINYLLLINQIDLLPYLFQDIIIPDVVRDEMLDPDAPLIVQEWIANPPIWLIIQLVPVLDTTLNSLDPGEQAAITLAQTLPADLLIIDERLGRQIAKERGIAIIGTLGILDDAASQGLIKIGEAIAQLQQTNFRISRRIIQALLNKTKD
ncbi:MAG: putative nucleic acid-binding protein, contains PIN domain [Phormidium sp. OSCR]|nr:MAG: putative nucleic acid-binding protein, contains PIN domain [Phormidium sp. OSCR]